MGYPIAIHGWYGLQGGATTWEGIPVFPAHLDAYGNDSEAYYCRKFKADLLITLIDLWVMDPMHGHLGHTRYCPYFPIDSADPIPPAIAVRFPHAHRLLVYSKYAEREVKAYDGGRFADKTRYIPHGISTDVLRPCTDAEKAAFRRKLFPDWPEDAWICLMVAANKGYPCRKSFPEAMEAFALFASAHPEARLYLHSYAESDFHGPNLQDMARHFGIQDKMRLANPRLLLAGDYTDEMMREIFCSADVLLAPSQGEGFCIPQLEMQACGGSVIVTDFSAQAELVGSGWRVPPLRLYPTLAGAKMAEADVNGTRHALEEAIRRPKSLHWQAIAREFALGYSWDKVLPLWQSFLEEADIHRGLALELEELWRQDAALARR